MPALLELRNLACDRGGRTLFDGVSLRLPAGGLLRVRGANGAGKTSLLRMLCGLLQPSRGDVLWRGEAVSALREEFGRVLLIRCAGSQPCQIFNAQFEHVGLSNDPSKEGKIALPVGDYISADVGIKRNKRRTFEAFHYCHHSIMYGAAHPADGAAVEDTCFCEKLLW